MGAIQAERKKKNGKMKACTEQRRSDARRNHEGLMKGFYQNKLALSGRRSVRGDECRRSAYTSL
jgi:hypothetical protein